MNRYVPIERQLVVEDFVCHVRANVFHQKLGFDEPEVPGTYVVLTWDGHKLLLDERSELATPPSVAQANLRDMVAEVDTYWARARAMAAPLLVRSADRPGGSRDSTILDRDGCSLRFGSQRQDQPARLAG
jgi:hypothetical protein